MRTWVAPIAMVVLVVMVGCGSSRPRLASPALADGDLAGERAIGPAELDVLAGAPDDERHPVDEAEGASHERHRADEEPDRDENDSAYGERRRRVIATAGPPVARVLSAAYAAAGLGARVPGHIAVRARLGGLVPWVSVRTGRDASWHDEDPDVGRGTTLEVRATWRLDRLVFDGRELQVVALEAARRRERRRLATHVIRTYFVWRRSASRSRADEAAAELDALTAGWFSEALQRAASEVRTAGSAAAARENLPEAP